MKTGWLTRVGTIDVEHVPCPSTGVAVDLSTPAKGVQHTTEGWDIESALSVFRKENAPHFLVGPDAKGDVRVLQLIPLGQIAAALEHHGDPPTNGFARAQIELVSFSKTFLWKPSIPVLYALGALQGALAQACNIPLKHVANTQRDPKVWSSGSGWFGHDGIPGNSHWDPGQLDWQAVFAHAGRTAPIPPVVKPRPKPLVLHPKTFTLVRRSNGLVYTENVDRPN